LTKSKEKLLTGTLSVLVSFFETKEEKSKQKWLKKYYKKSRI